jgi:hypothetical protein
MWKFCTSKTSYNLKGLSFLSKELTQTDKENTGSQYKKWFKNMNDQFIKKDILEPNKDMK